MDWFEERLHENFRLSLRADSVLYRDKTEHQDLIIFENARFGRVLALDGVVQTTEGDECAYHEMLAHVPILAHGAVRHVLIVGGGDGGCLREVLKHDAIETATMVELDRSVVDLSREHLPSLSAGAFDDPRAELVIADGAAFVAETDRRFDLVVIDSTDPIGPGEALFSESFYGGCRRCLNEGGILITQNGVPFLQSGELRNSHARLSKHFADVTFYLTVVPTYAGGFMALGWATDNPAYRAVPADVLNARYAAAGLATRYYNPDVHAASFALPNFVREMLA